MLSHRLAWDQPPNRLAAALAARRAAGLPVIDLTEANPTRAGLAPPAEELRTALAAPDAHLYAPDPRGLPSARAAVAAYYADRGGPVDPARIFLTAGTSDGYAWLCKLLADPGDEILVPAPSYPLLPLLAELEGDPPRALSAGLARGKRLAHRSGRAGRGHRTPRAGADRGESAQSDRRRTDARGAGRARRALRAARSRPDRRRGLSRLSGRRRARPAAVRPRPRTARRSPSC